jgi:feruloyl esterase
MKSWITGSVVFVAISAGGLQAAVPCESLKGFAMKNVTITMAQTVAAGEFVAPVVPRGAAPATPPAEDADGAPATPPRGGGRGGPPPVSYKDVPAFCRVAATLRPVKDSEIKIEVWLPAAGWNGKMEAVGNGAWAGSISFSALATAVRAGYAGTSTDTGHSGGNPATFTIGHPEKVIDFAYRSVHEMAVTAKAVIRAYYGDAPKFSYFNGCSTGGRQAITAVQRYPKDFDGVVAGAPAMNVSHLQGNQAWTGQIAHLDEGGYIPATKYPALQAAALNSCDALDGVTDRVIENPRVCKFDPAVMLCTGEDNISCLTAPQVEVAKKVYSGVTNSVTGKSIFPGLEPGSERGWASLSGPRPMALGVEVFRYLVHQDPAWTLAKFNADTDIPLAAKTIGPLMDAMDPNLKPFADRGGKLLIYHGWADPGISPRNSVNYYESVVDKIGAAKASKSIRLFMVPGMGHCSGGDGTDRFDAVAAIDQWVEKGKAPDSIAASHQVRGGAVDKTRPLCPYPQTAQYKGSGSTNEAVNFVCK